METKIQDPHVQTRRKTGITLAMKRLLPRKEVQRKSEVDRTQKLLPKTTVWAPPPEDPTWSPVARKRQQTHLRFLSITRSRKMTGQTRVREHSQFCGTSRWRPDYEISRFRKGVYLKKVCEPQFCLWQNSRGTSGF